MARLIRIAVLLQKSLIVAYSLLIAATFGAVVVLRYGFETNLFAYEEWILAAAFTMYFIGAAQGSHDSTALQDAPSESGTEPRSPHPPRFPPPWPRSRACHF